MDAVYDVQSLTNSSSSNPRTPSPIPPHDDLRFAYMPDSFDHHPPEALKDQPRYWQSSAPGTASASNLPGTSSASIPVPTNGSAGASASATAASSAKTANGPFLNEYLNENASVASDDAHALYPGYFRADWALHAQAHDPSGTNGSATTMTTTTMAQQQTSTQPLSTTTPPHISASPQSLRLHPQDHHHHQHHPGLYRGQSYPAAAAHQEHDIHHRPPLVQHHQQHQQHQQQHHQLHHPHQYHSQQSQQSQHSQHPQYPTQQQQHQHHQQHHQQQQQLLQQHQQHQHNSQHAHPSLMAAPSNPQDVSKYVHSDHHHGHNHHHQPFSAHPPPADHDHDSVKLEHTSMVVPSQLNHHYYRPGSSSSSISNVSSGHPPPTYIPSTMSTIPIMHTDDAASKETQYLRRKCFNCQTTEPPSWRRSTLNPGKIVCNKCGLYERTHNKPRPHQFGLRPGNKARKQSKPAHDASSSPKVRHGITVKKDIDYAHPVRRGSVNGEWDDNYGNGTMYPTLGMHPHPHPHPPAARTHHHHPYQMPPPHHHQSGGIRLPQAPPMSAGSMMSNSTPDTPYGSLPPSASVPAMYGNQLRGAPVVPSADYFIRRGSVTPDMGGGIGPVRRHTVSSTSPGGVSVGVGGHQSGMQDMTWQHPVPLSEMSVTPAPALTNLGSAGSTPRKLLNGNGTPPPIVAPTSAGGSPSSAASAGATVNAPTPAVAPTESARAAVTA